MVRHHVLTLDGTVQRLDTALAIADDLPLKFLSLQPFGANAGITYVGGRDGSTLSSTNYGARLEIPVSTIPSAPFIVELPIGAVRLSDIVVKGTNTDKLSILLVT